MQMTLSDDQLAFGPRSIPDCRSIRLFAGLSFLFSVLGVGSARAQEASIRGVVSDESKAMMAGVDITLTNLDTKVTRRAVTDASGFYQVPLLKEGRYQVQASISGFQSKQAEVRVEVGQVVQLDFQLQVGKISDMVEVQASADRIQQQPYNVGTVVEEKQIRELPLNGRNYLSLANLSPGILRGGSAGRGEQSADEGGFRSGGLPMDMTAILVDGVDNASRTVQGPLITQAQTLKPAVEAISEFKVVTNNVSAEYGYKAGAQVLVSTKSGTNQFHGDVYEFHRNAAVAANNFMFNRDGPRDPNTNELIEKKPPYIRNQFGATLGGPVIRDTTFFFVSFQGTRLREGGDSFLQSVPSPPRPPGRFLPRTQHRQRQERGLRSNDSRGDGRRRGAPAVSEQPYSAVSLGPCGREADRALPVAERSWK
jgi:Carboxypeptidase regulatory-like domain